MGIDPREGTLLTLFALKLARGASPADLMRSMAFKNEYVREIARALAGDINVSATAQGEADRIRAWAQLPAA
jgi:hypothetical protein